MLSGSWVHSARAPARSRGEPNLPLSLLATALVALAFEPLRERFQKVANRLVYGRRPTPYEVLAAFSRRMVGALSVDEVLPRLAEAAAQRVGAARSRVRVYVRPARTRPSSARGGGGRVSLYPESEPYASGRLEVGDGQQLYWETCGNPAGKPALVLHGGPGSGCTPGHRRYFDPAAYRIVLFDQRGTGRSTPRVGATTDVSANTTEHLIADIERLREQLGIRRWLVWGNSWGVTLGLAYAQRYPERVTEMVLAAVTMTRPADIHWLYHEAGRFFPEEWQRFRAGVPPADRDGDLVAAYYHLLHEQPDVARREQAARDWCAWEDAAMSLEEGWTPHPRYADPAFRMTFARIVTHYFHHHAWLADGQLLRDADRLAGVPGVLIHGRLDLGSPTDTAWQLAQAWAGAELHLVRAGHAGGKDMLTYIIEATNAFASRA